MDEFGGNLEQARVRASSGDLVGALKFVEAALRAARDAQVFRARLLQALGRTKEALFDIHMLDGPQSSARFLEMRADLEESLVLVEEAIVTLGRLISVANDPGLYLGRRAVLHQSLGHFDEALQDIDQALVLRPLDGELYRLRSGLTHFTRDDEITKKMESVRKRLKPGGLSIAHLDFARAAAFDDIGDINASFQALKLANSAMRQNHPYDINTRLAMTRSVRENFALVTPERFEPADEVTFAPIFVTGQPRSGTTLVEQILAAHRDVSAGGESALFSDALAKTIGDPVTTSPAKLQVTPEGLTALSRHYVNALSGRIGDAKRVTDKSLQSLLYAGPILTAFPKSHIVLVRRDPNATALSLFRQVFRPGKHLYSYDLDDIRTFQRDYDELAAFWLERLPSERLLVLDYEDLVSNPEHTVRDLLEKTGLSWDPACLEPERNNGPVLTLSNVAVRRPINASAMNAWKKYAAFLNDKHQV